MRTAAGIAGILSVVTGLLLRNVWLPTLAGLPTAAVACSAVVFAELLLGGTLLVLWSLS